MVFGKMSVEYEIFRSHGRDQKLCVWKLDRPDEIHMSKTLPAEEQQEAGSRSHWPCPWLLHVLEINTLNFCAFSMCAAQLSPLNSRERWEGASPIYLAVPNALNSGSVSAPGPSRKFSWEVVLTMPSRSTSGCYRTRSVLGPLRSRRASRQVCDSAVERIDSCEASF